MYGNEDFFRIIGHVSVFFATLDFLVSEVMIRLARPGASPLFSDTTTLGQKLSLLGNLKPADVTDPKVLTDLRKELPRAQSAARERNRYIHDQWMFESEQIGRGGIRRAKLVVGPRPKIVIQDLTISELEDFLYELGALQKIFAEALKILNPSGVSLN